MKTQLQRKTKSEKFETKNAKHATKSTLSEKSVLNELFCGDNIVSGSDNENILTGR